MNSKILKGSILLFSFLIGILMSFYAQAFEMPAEFKNHNWKTGDIVAMTILKEDTTAMFYEAATASRYSHIGVVIELNNELFVVEAIKPQARFSKLVEFLERAGQDSTNGALQATVLEHTNPLTTEEQKQLTVTAQEIVNKPTLFNEKVTLDLVQLNAAELVFFLFKQIQKEVGSIETVGDINHRAFNGIVWELFQQTGLEITLESPIITPMNIVLSQNLVAKVANLPTKEYLSDQALYAQWKAEGHVEKLAELIGATIADLDELAASSSNEPYKKLR